MRTNKNVWLNLKVLLCALLLGACAVPTEHAIQKPFFETPQVVKLDVAKFEVVNAYQAPLKRPNIEHLFQTMPSHVIQNFSESLFVAVGERRHAKLIIVDASVISESLNVSSDLRGVLTVEQKERYTARAELLLEIRSNRGFLESYASATAHIVRSIPEGLTLNEMDKVFHEITRALIHRLHIELTKQINQHLKAFIA